MHAEYDTQPRDTEELCDLLECMCEGFVRAHIVEIGGDPDAFPCCVKCGKFGCDELARWPSEPAPEPAGDEVSPSSTLGKAYFKTDRRPLPTANPGPSAVRCRPPSEIVRRKRGTPVDLAVFQCAQERRRDRKCYVGISHDDTGDLRAFVVYPDGTVKDPLDDIVSDAECGCEVPHA